MLMRTDAISKESHVLFLEELPRIIVFSASVAVDKATKEALVIPSVIRNDSLQERFPWNQ